MFLRQIHQKGPEAPVLEEIAEIRLRLPASLRQQLKARAKTQHRTMNGEIVALIEAAVTTSDDREGAQK